jgi:hypothetical protein
MISAIAATLMRHNAISNMLRTKADNFARLLCNGILRTRIKTMPHVGCAPCAR